MKAAAAVLLRLSLSAALLAALGWLVDWRALGPLWAAQPWWLWPAALLVYAAAQLASALRWRLAARLCGLELPFGEAVRLYWAGMFANLFLPTSIGGDAVKAAVLGRRTGRLGAAAASVLLERFSGLVALLLLGGLGGLAALREGVPWWVAGGLLAGGLAGWAGPALVPPALLARLGETKRAALAALAAGWRAGPLLGLALLVQALNILLVAGFAWALGGGGSPAGHAAVMAVVTLAGLLPVSFNGVGLREWAFAAGYGWLGLPPELGVSTGLLFLGVSAVCSLPGAWLASGLNLAHKKGEHA